MSTAKLKSRKSVREERTAILFLAPFIIGFVVFNFLPLFYSLFLSLVNFNELGAIRTNEFIGLKNYRRVFNDRLALAAYGRSFYFTAVYAFGIIVLSLLTALLLNRSLFSKVPSRTMIYMPYVANVIAVSMVWSVVLNPFDGPVGIWPFRRSCSWQPCRRFPRSSMNAPKSTAPAPGKSSSGSPCR
jgi:multiple sugar transport system permease protein